MQLIQGLFQRMPTGSNPTDQTSCSTVRIRCQTAGYQTCCPTVPHCKVNYLEPIKEHLPPLMLTAVLGMKSFLRVVSQGYVSSLLCIEEGCMLCVWEEWGSGRKEADKIKCKPHVVQGVSQIMFMSQRYLELWRLRAQVAEHADGRWCFCCVCLYAAFLICFCH